MDTHIQMLICRIEGAQSFAQLLRGVRRSRLIAGRHGLRWQLVRDAAYGAARSNGKGVV